MYESEKVTYSNLGSNKPPKVDVINLAIQRITLTAWFWLICITGYEFLPKYFGLF